MKYAYIFFLFFVTPSLIAQHTTQTMKVMSGVQSGDGFKLVVAETSKDNGLLNVVKVMEMNQYRQHEHFKIPKADKIFVVAVPVSENVSEGEELSKDLSEDIQILGVESMRSFNLTITQSEDGVFHYMLTNVRWEHHD